MSRTIASSAACKRRCRSGRVGLVPSRHRLAQTLDLDLTSSCSLVLLSASRPLDVARRQEDLHRGVGEHDGADVATFDDAAAVLLGPRALPSHEDRAHLGVGRDRRHGRRHLWAADLVGDVASVEHDCAVEREIDRTGDLAAGGAVVEGDVADRAPPA